VRIARLLGKHLRMVRADTPAKWLFTDGAEAFDGVVLVWPVFRENYSAGNIIFYVHLDFPGARPRTAVRELRPLAWRKISAMIEAADAEFAFARDQLARLQSKNDI
jgi:hypothetical protein